MSFKSCEFLNRHIRRKYPRIHYNLKKMCKNEISLNQVGYAVYFMSDRSSPAHTIWEMERDGTIDVYKYIEEKLLICKDNDALAFSMNNPNMNLYTVYRPTYNAVASWASNENSRKAYINNLLKELNKDDKRNFGEKMRDLRKPIKPQ